jgi:hypothetical protein
MPVFIISEFQPRWRGSSYIEYLVQAEDKEAAIKKVKNLTTVIIKEESYEAREIDINEPYFLFDSADH